jgi:hypothetical protein
MILPVTLSLAAALAVISLWLGVRVGQVRMKEKVITGDGGNALLIARMRAQSNFVEYVPFILILVGLIEASGGNPTILWAAAAVTIVGRLLHPLGMDKTTPNALRGGGFLATALVLLGLAIWAVFIAAGAPPSVELGIDRAASA